LRLAAKENDRKERTVSRQLQSQLSLYAIATCLSNLIAAPVFGQVQQYQNNAWGSKTALDRNANIQQLKDTPELPQLPSYSGKLKFLRGYCQPSGKGWTVYQISFLTKEDPPKVKDWYENALGMYKWKILSSAGQTLTANHKDGHICTIIFNPTTMPGFRTRLGMFFSQAPQITAPEE
jgi:hypothetical protein